jgi:para-aminobenzoate synthetase component 1
VPRPRLATVHALTPLARFGGVVASGLQDVTHDPEALDSSGFWAVVADFDGRLTCARFGDVRSQPVPAPAPGVGADRIAVTGRRRSTAPRTWTAYGASASISRRGTCIRPICAAGTVRLPAHGVEITTASPELFPRRTGELVESGPVKGTGRTGRTGRTEADLLEKDRAENVLIVDLVLLAIASNRETVTGTDTGTVTREKTDTYAHESEAAYVAASGRTAS